MAESRFSISRFRDMGSGLVDGTVSYSSSSFHYNVWDSEIGAHVAIEHSADNTEDIRALRALVRFLNTYCPSGESPAHFLRRLLNDVDWNPTRVEIVRRL